MYIKLKFILNILGNSIQLKKLFTFIFISFSTNMYRTAEVVEAAIDGSLTAIYINKEKVITCIGS